MTIDDFDERAADTSHLLQIWLVILTGRGPTDLELRSPVTRAALYRRVTDEIDARIPPRSPKASPPCPACHALHTGGPDCPACIAAVVHSHAGDCAFRGAILPPEAG
jgi:hypothetical protein